MKKQLLRLGGDKHMTWMKIKVTGSQKAANYLLHYQYYALLSCTLKGQLAACTS